MQVCFFCGSANGPDARTCYSCGQALAAGEEEGTEEESVPLEGLTECPFCGNEVAAEDTECPHCRTTLVSSDPLDRPAPKTHERDITGRYDEFATKVELLRAGKMTREQFATWLDTVQNSLLGQRERYVDMIKSSGYFEWGQNEVEVGMTGILAYEEAMEMMKIVARSEEEPDLSVLDTALTRMWEGNELCNEAMRINREFRAKLEEDWGYM